MWIFDKTVMQQVEQPQNRKKNIKSFLKPVKSAEIKWEYNISISCHGF